MEQFAARAGRIELSDGPNNVPKMRWKCALHSTAMLENECLNDDGTHSRVSKFSLLFPS